MCTSRTAWNISADPGSILITSETYTAAREFVEVEPVGMHAIRGLPTPIELFKLRGLQHAPSSGVFRSGRRLSRLIGRHEQSQALERELEHTIQGDGRVVGVVGEAGIGKSRLCFEFAESCRGKGIRVFEARVLAHGKSTPFQPVLELLRDFFGLRVKEPIEDLRRRVLDRLTTIPLSEPSKLVLLEFLGLADPIAPDGQARPQGAQDPADSILSERWRVPPRRDVTTVVLIEDLHWIDAASEEFVEALADAVVGTPRFWWSISGRALPRR